ncbi:MAG: hypothetical protein ACPG48_00055 [Candidatus Puniceispirillaceae bacterium]
MTLILETQQSNIHRCPACGAQCAVEKDIVARARESGQHIRIACHKCDEIFQPMNDNSPVSAAATPSQPNPNPRVGICTACGDSLSVPPLNAGEAVMVECPHCRHLMRPDDVGRADALADLPSPPQPPSPRQRIVGTLLSLLLAGALIAGFAASAIFRITPPLPTPFGLEISPAPHFAVTEARFDAALDGASGAVLVTVTLANLGTAAGAPDRVAVTLLDSAGSPVASRPIAVREAVLAPGDKRTITARLSVPADGIEDMTVTIVEADRPD